MERSCLLDCPLTPALGVQLVTRGLHGLRRRPSAGVDDATHLVTYLRHQVPGLGRAETPVAGLYLGSAARTSRWRRARRPQMASGPRRAGRPWRPRQPAPQGHLSRDRVDLPGPAPREVATAPSTPCAPNQAQPCRTEANECDDRYTVRKVGGQFAGGCDEPADPGRANVMVDTTVSIGRLGSRSLHTVTG